MPQKCFFVLYREEFLVSKKSDHPIKMVPFSKPPVFYSQKFRLLHLHTYLKEKKKQTKKVLKRYRKLSTNRVKRTDFNLCKCGRTHAMEISATFNNPPELMTTASMFLTWSATQRATEIATSKSFSPPTPTSHTLMRCGVLFLLSVLAREHTLQVCFNSFNQEFNISLLFWLATYQKAQH